MRRTLTCWLPLLAAACLALGPAPAGAEPLNVAPLLGTATQSSTGYGGNPERAIDGNTSGVWGNGSITHTADGDVAPWWEVDLLEDRVVDTVVLWNRTDTCCVQRLTDFRLIALDSEGEEVWIDELYSDGLTYPNPSVEIDLEGTECRVIRIERLGADSTGTLFLSLAEVQVFVDSSTVPTSILRQPQGGRSYVSECFIFSVSLFNTVGATSITYQWYKDDAEIQGAKGERLAIGPLRMEDSGTYKVVATVDGETLTSDPAELVVPGVNFALGGTATQSSGGTYPASLAIDGNLGNFTHTANTDLDPTWQVDLGAVYPIETIILHNRDDCCQLRLRDITVSILDSTGLVEEFVSDLLNPENEMVNPELIEVDLLDLIGEPVEGQIVRVVRTPDPDWSGGGTSADDASVLSLGEVEVIGVGEPPPEDPRRNLAYDCGVTTWQSTTNGAFASALAINGNLNDFTHTVNTDEDATWEIDLQGDYDIALITLYNRAGCCQWRLRDIVVSILDGEGDLVWQSDLLNPENELGWGTVVLTPENVIGQSLAVNVVQEEGAPVTGQTVRVQRVPDPDWSGGGTSPDDAYVLSLGEVEIFALPSDCPDEGDTHCEDLVVEGPDGDYPGIYTITAFADDDSGDPILYTFTIDNGLDPPVVIGPQEENTLERRLGTGEYTISVHVDDDPICIDESNDPDCATDVEVIDIENLIIPGLAVATQSSEYTTSFPASNAIDGNFGNFTHTANDNVDLSDAWWQVDLLDEQPIGRVVLYNRTSCCGSRLRDIIVSILDFEGEVLWQSDLLNEENALYEYEDGPPSITVDIEQLEGAGVEGQFVRVTRVRDDDLSGTGGQGNEGEPGVLSLAEVEVYPATGVVQEPEFKRGDANADGTINITDGIFVLNYLFLGGPTPPCLEAANPNDDADINITDGIYVLNFLFLGGPAPESPGPDDCGPDPVGSPTDLGCDSFPGC